jgi:hypothetical protein
MQTRTNAYMHKETSIRQIIIGTLTRPIGIQQNLASGRYNFDCSFAQHTGRWIWKGGLRKWKTPQKNHPKPTKTQWRIRKVREPILPEGEPDHPQKIGIFRKPRIQPISAGRGSVLSSKKPDQRSGAGKRWNGEGMTSGLGAHLGGREADGRPPVHCSPAARVSPEQCEGKDRQ